MNEQLQPLKKQPRAGKAGRSGTQDDIVYAHIFEAITRAGADDRLIDARARPQPSGEDRIANVIGYLISEVAAPHRGRRRGGGVGGGARGACRCRVTFQMQRWGGARQLPVGAVRAGYHAGVGAHAGARCPTGACLGRRFARRAQGLREHQPHGEARSLPRRALTRGGAIAIRAGRKTTRAAVSITCGPRPNWRSRPPRTACWKARGRGSSPPITCR